MLYFGSGVAISSLVFYVERIEKASAVYDRSKFQKLVLQMNSQNFAKLINRKKRRSRFRFFSRVTVSALCLLDKGLMQKILRKVRISALFLAFLEIHSNIFC